jgi:hypothetical protein
MESAQVVPHKCFVDQQDLDGRNISLDGEMPEFSEASYGQQVHRGIRRTLLPTDFGVTD